jgi:hypothetical protein
MSYLDKWTKVLGVGPWGDYEYEGELYASPRTGKLRLHGPDGWMTARDNYETNLGGAAMVILGNQDLVGLAYKGDPIKSYADLSTRIKEDYPRLHRQMVSFIKTHSGDPVSGDDWEPETVTALREAFKL